MCDSTIFRFVNRQCMLSIARRDSTVNPIFWIVECDVHGSPITHSCEKNVTLCVVVFTQSAWTAWISNSTHIRISCIFWQKPRSDLTETQVRSDRNPGLGQTWVFVRNNFVSETRNYTSVWPQTWVFVGRPGFLSEMNLTKTQVQSEKKPRSDLKKTQVGFEKNTGPVVIDRPRPSHQHLL